MKLIEKQFIFDSEKVIYGECHASTVLALDDGTFVSAWFGGEKESRDDVMIWLSRCENGVWTSPVCVTKEEGIPHWNPVLYGEDDGSVTLYYKVGKKIWDWKTMFMKSFDGTKSWTGAQELVQGDETGGRGPVRNKILKASNGYLLAPASTERERWLSFVDLFDGENWTKKEIPVKTEEKDIVKMIQPALWESEKGHIHALMRTSAGLIYRSDSSDFGQSWCKAYATNMPNNNSGIDCVKTHDGTVVLVCNPNGKDWGARTPLSVFASKDNGKSFEKQLDLETQEGEFSYPCIISKENKVYVTYTYKRKNIAFCEIEL